MRFYLDASVAVSLFVRDVHTLVAERWEQQLTEAQLVSTLCLLEFSATVSRSFRTGRLSAQEASDALADFDEWRFASTIEHALASDDYTLADSLVRDFATSSPPRMRCTSPRR
jgi:predicted nucleic acid-binding protein